jgi:hypothetical protein
MAEIVGWAKRSVPTIRTKIYLGGHGASAPLPTLQDQRSFPRAATGSTPTISSPRTITTSSIMLTTTQT